MNAKIDTKELKDLSRDLEQIASELDADAKSLCYDDAKTLKGQLLAEYTRAVEKTPIDIWRMPNNNKRSKRYTGQDETIGVTTTLSRLGEAKGVMGYVSPAMNGFYVSLTGDDVAFVEYGTGTAGKEEGYPGKLGNWKYNSGATISKGTGKDVPGWRREIDYKASAADYDDLRRGKPLWIYDGIVRNGMPGSAFMYFTIEAYRSNYEHRNYEYHMTSKGLTTLISKKLQKK